MLDHLLNAGYALFIVMAASAAVAGLVGTIRAGLRGD